MTKSIEIDICKGRLKISKEKFEGVMRYMIYHSDLMLYIHAKVLKFGQRNNKHGWLMFYENGIYVGSVWINTDTDMEKIKQFLEETK